MTTSEKILAGAALVAAVGGVALVVRMRRSDGTVETIDGIEEVTVTAKKLPAPLVPLTPEKVPDTSGQSLAQRNNNPGNLRSWPGVTVKNGYAVFPTLLAGARASFINLNTYMTKHNLVTLRGIIGRWAPPEDDNPTSAYVAAVAKVLNVSPDQRLLYSTHAKRIMPAMWRVEAGVKFWPDSLVEDAYKAAGK